MFAGRKDVSIQKTTEATNTRTYIQQTCYRALTSQTYTYSLYHFKFYVAFLTLHLFVAYLS